MLKRLTIDYSLGSQHKSIEPVFSLKGFETTNYKFAQNF